MIGQTLSHYRIVEKLGSGGRGEIYVAELLSPLHVGGISVSHDNRCLYYSRETPEAHIWILTLEEERE